ncbi:MAG: hypothetical protein JJU11_07995 [Candidatus Sumerlaeia bacterium]|nr:hypothetical protein [Candidatus Sumerlaeia bacterium]
MTSELLRRSLSLRSGKGNIANWASELVQVLEEAKSDHEVFVFGISRDLKTPNYLLGTSQEMIFPPPIRITMTKRTADVFVGHGKVEVRLISQEFPMSVNCHPEGEERQIPLNFYEAVCFDCGDISIVLGLIVHDSDLSEFMTQQEIVDLHPLIYSHAIPLFELFLLRSHVKRADKDVSLLVNLMRETNPDIAKIQLELESAHEEKKVLDEDFDSPTSDNETFSVAFVQYLTRELGTHIADARQYLQQLAQQGPDARRIANSVQRGVAMQQNILRNIHNLAALANPEVRPLESTCSLAELAGRVQSSALRLATPYQLTVNREDKVQDITVKADLETLAKLIDRLIEYIAASCMQGTMWIRIRSQEESPVDGCATLEIEDTAHLPESFRPEELLDSSEYLASKHPRLTNGGGVLYQLLTLYLEKTGGHFRLHPGRSGGLVTAFLLPVVSEEKFSLLNEDAVLHESQEESIKLATSEELDT